MMVMADTPIRPAMTPLPPPANPASSFGSILTRLNAVIAEETAMLNRRQSGELQAFTMRKNQLLFELTKALKSSPVEELHRLHAAQLQELQWRLEANRKLLATHLDAAKEVSQTIIEAIRQADSDGTYVPGRGSGKPLA